MTDLPCTALEYFIVVIETFHCQNPKLKFSYWLPWKPRANYVNCLWQVLGKSAKPIPVMILGVLIGRKRYPLAKYLFVLLIVIGVALFIFKDGKTAAGNEKTYGWGEILLVSILLVFLIRFIIE